MSGAKDPSLDALLDLHGQVLVVDAEAGYVVRFVVNRVPATTAKPHGLDYSLTLHGPQGERLVGFDNARPVPPQARGGRRRIIVIGCAGFGPTTTATRPRCLRVSGARSMRCCGNRE